MSTLASPASNGGRGLKLDLREALIRDRAASPASNGGRGLKPPGCGRSTSALPHRPPAMAGAD